MKKCVLYTRVSTSTQAEVKFNSCEAQRNKILSYIASQDDLQLTAEYSDPGFTGSDLERPGLQRMLSEIQHGCVDTVLTYKIDRLTRSSKDFYNLIELFEKHSVTYISVTEHFDTASPSGRLLRNIMLTFAQFEREMTAERTKDKMQQRAEKGMWNGGNTPLGYKRENKKLIIDTPKAKMVKDIYDWFIDSGSSKTAYRNAIQNKFINPITNKPLTFSTIGYILRNPIYTGSVKWGHQLFPGVHEPIISKRTFDHTQTLLKEKRRKKRTYKTFVMAGGILKCNCCGSSMTSYLSNSKGRRYHYYKCVSVMKKGKEACSLKQIGAEKIEEFLFNSLIRTADDRQFIENLALKMAHQVGGRVGLEILEECSKSYEKSISETLQRFKNDIQAASKIDQIQILRKTVKRINFKKECLEVTVRLQDTTLPIGGGNVSNPPTKPAAGGGPTHKKTHAPRRDMGFATPNWLPGQISQGTLVWSKTAIQFEKILKNTARIVQKGPVLPAEEMTAAFVAC